MEKEELYKRVEHLKKLAVGKIYSIKGCGHGVFSGEAIFKGIDGTLLNCELTVHSLSPDCKRDGCYKVGQEIIIPFSGCLRIEVPEGSYGTVVKSEDREEVDPISQLEI